MSTPEWATLMNAPWGKFTPEAKAAKAVAQEQYRKATIEFWKRRGKNVPE